MITGSELNAWLGSLDRQAASGRRAAALIERWAGHPLVRDLEADLKSIKVKTPDAVEQVAARFLARHDEVAAWMRELIAAAAADPFFMPPFQTINSDISSGIILYSDLDLMIALNATSADALAAKKTGPRGATSIAFSGLQQLFHYVKAGGTTLSLWEADPVGQDFAADPERTCRFVGRRTLRDGETMRLDGRRESFVIEHARSDLVFLQAVIHTGGAPLQVEYDSKTLRYVGASNADEASSRIQILVSILRLLDRGDAVPQLVELLDNPDFYTRWYVMREFLAMDADTAYPHLQRMAALDPHPEVRAMAAQTLATYFPQEEAA